MTNVKDDLRDPYDVKKLVVKTLVTFLALLSAAVASEFIARIVTGREKIERSFTLTWYVSFLILVSVGQMIYDLISRGLRRDLEALR